MATLTNPINAQNIIDRFADYVTATANSGIEWGTNIKPVYSWSTYSSNGYSVAGGSITLAESTFGGNTAGIAIGISGAGFEGAVIKAIDIVNTLRNETARYAVIRSHQVRLTVTATGGKDGNKDWDGLGRNRGTIPSGGLVFDQTKVSHLGAGYALAPAAPATTLTATTTISAVGLETFFGNLRTAYQNVRNTAHVTDVTVCHSSCHLSCHNSRGRR
jgi:hypothetical protein